MTAHGVPMSLLHMPTPPTREATAGRIVSPLNGEADEAREAEKRRKELQEESRARMKKLHASAEFKAQVDRAYARRRVTKLEAKIAKLQDQMLGLQLALHAAKQEAGK